MKEEEIESMRKVFGELKGRIEPLVKSPKVKALQNRVIDIRKNAIDNNEELLISKFDYAQLNSNITYGQITDDDRLILTPSGGPIKICLHEPGMICINSFIYPIKRKNTLPTISTNQLGEKISSNQTQRIEASKEKIANLIQNNVFIQEDKWINRISSTLTRKQKRQLKNIL